MLEGEDTARGVDALSAWTAAIVESSDDAIIGKTLTGEITSWNASAELIYGYSAAEAVGRHISMLAPPGHQDEFDELLATIARGERVRHLETVRQRKDGELIDVSVTISPVRDAAGRIIGASTIARDIAERKRAEQATARLAAIVDSSDDAIIAETLEGRIISWNEAAERLYGYGAEEAIGQHISMLSPTEQSGEMEGLLARVARRAARQPLRDPQAAQGRRPGRRVADHLPDPQPPRRGRGGLGDRAGRRRAQTRRARP